MSYGAAELFFRRGKKAARPSDVSRIEFELEEYCDVDIAIVCESTYPYRTGGLSAVVHQICVANPNSTIGILHISWDSVSPREILYDVPPQVAWVKPVFQSLEEHADTFKKFTPKDVGLSKPVLAGLPTRVFDAITAHFDGSDDQLWQLYDEGINPLTRWFRLWPVISTREFMMAAVAYFADSGLSFTSLFWSLREFFCLTYVVTDVVHPRAKVYHAHTTGAASVLAAAAARQHDAQFFLTEHNLYARDTINHALGRSMDTAVKLEDWRTLDRFMEAGSVPHESRVTPNQRAWMAWWSRLGVLAYRAAAHITYLYPEAIEEARGLGALPEKASVVPNGVTPEHFDDSRKVFEARQRSARESSDPRIWKLAYAARVVPIKGLLDLLEALALLVDRSIVNWELDVMGPDTEMPDYAELCRSRCHELGLDGYVRFLGSVNLRERFGYYDVLLLPSHNEGQPIVVLEAMTIGLPTIGTYVGGMKQLVEDPLEVTSESGESVLVGAGGALVKSRDVQGLAREISSLIRDDEAFDRFSRNSRIRADRYFHIDTAMEMYRTVYKRLIEDGAAKAAEAGADASVLYPETLAQEFDSAVEDFSPSR